MQKNQIDPVTGLDYPDPDVIRVEDTYYMISTAMHFFPGGEILRSYDLCPVSSTHLSRPAKRGVLSLVVRLRSW